MKSNRVFILLYVILLSQFFFVGQAYSSQRTENKHAVTLTLGGQHFLYSLGYDYTFIDQLALGADVSYIGDGSDGIFLGGIHTNVYPVGSDTVAMMVTGSINFANIDFDYEDVGLQGSEFYGTIGVGVEYRKNLIFRAQVLSYITQHDFFIPWLGISIGAAF